MLLEPDWLQKLLFPEHKPGGLLSCCALACIAKFAIEKFFRLGPRDVIHW